MVVGQTGAIRWILCARSTKCCYIPANSPANPPSTLLPPDSSAINSTVCTHPPTDNCVFLRILRFSFARLSQNNSPLSLSPLSTSKRGLIFARKGDLIARKFSKSFLYLSYLDTRGFIKYIYYRLKNLFEFARSISIERIIKDEWKEGLRPLVYSCRRGGCFIDGCRAAGVRR